MLPSRLVTNLFVEPNVPPEQALGFPKKCEPIPNLTRVKNNTQLTARIP
jgi:hypothetical protein